MPDVAFGVGRDGPRCPTEQGTAGRAILAAFDRWEDMPDAAGTWWAMKLARRLAEKETPAPDED